MTDIERLSPIFFFDLTDTGHEAFFSEKVFVWDLLKELQTYLLSLELGKISCAIPKGVHLVNKKQISIGKGTIIEPGAYIEGPCFIGENCHIRHAAYLRPDLLICDGCTIGHASEIKHSIMLKNGAIPHFNYVGDSIIGQGVNLGAGVICANLRLNHKEICVKIDEKEYNTGLKKFGAVVGDYSQIGCNSVLNPGTLLKKSSFIYPCSSFQGINL